MSLAASPRGPRRVAFVVAHAAQAKAKANAAAKAAAAGAGSGGVRAAARARKAAAAAATAAAVAAQAAVAERWAAAAGWAQTAAAAAAAAAALARQGWGIVQSSDWGDVPRADAVEFGSAMLTRACPGACHYTVSPPIVAHARRRPWVGQVGLCLLEGR